MLTLSYGYKKPETGDRGSVWFPALEDNITRLNSHDHDGVDSVLLTPDSLQKPTSTIAIIDWVDDGGGNYHKEVTVPIEISAAANFADIKYYGLICQIGTAGATFGDRVYPDIERETATTFTVRTNDNSTAMLIYYV